MDENRPAEKRRLAASVDSKQGHNADDEPPPKRVKALIQHFEKGAPREKVAGEKRKKRKTSAAANAKSKSRKKDAPPASPPVASEQPLRAKEEDLAPPTQETIQNTQSTRSLTEVVATTPPPKQQDEEEEEDAPPMPLTSLLRTPSISKTNGITDAPSTSSSRKVRFSAQNFIKLYVPERRERYVPPARQAMNRRKQKQGKQQTKPGLFKWWLVACTVLVAVVALTRILDSTSATRKVTPRTPTDMTLRQFLTDPAGFHLAMAPSFFGYFGYFGALAAWDEQLSNNTFSLLQDNIHSVAGASSGAMSAILLAAGIPPRSAADFCTTITLEKFADFPGLLTVFRGNKFQQIMMDFLADQKPNSTFQLQDAVIPVAVSGFDLQTMDGKLLRRGNMARAARASACFPFLFQPVGWIDKEAGNNYLFVDGGLQDVNGLNGLSVFQPDTSNKRVINLVVGDFLGKAPGPSSMPLGVHASQVVSISVMNLPQCGPWAMEKGPLAVEGSIGAMTAALDIPLLQGVEEGHYLLPIDASSFVPKL